MENEFDLLSKAINDSKTRADEACLEYLPSLMTTLKFQLLQHLTKNVR